MKSSEICQLAVNICTWMYGRVAYRNDSSWLPNDQSLYPKYNGLTWWSDAWHADCLGFVRAVLCGWNADKTVDCGGANTGYPCYWYNEQMFIDSCLPTEGGGGVSSDFTQLSQHPCSLLYKDGHVGLYVGELQIAGKSYNTCEVTTSYIDDEGRPGGGRLAWVDPDGRRRPSKDEPMLNSWWEQWGIFGTAGTKYGITEYDGGASGVTGFGTELSQDEVNKYFADVYDQPWLTYAYLEALADTLYGMDSSYFRVLAGYVYGENPTGFDDYMLYLDSSIPINMYMGYGMVTPQQLSDFWRTPPSKDPLNYYTVAALTGRGNDLEADTTSEKGKRSLVGIYLALMNPMQECVECVGYPVYDPRPPVAQIIYTQYNVPIWGGTTPEQWAMRDANGVHSYDITGSGIRGGWQPVPIRKIDKTLITIKPIQMRNWYRWSILRSRR